MRGNSRTNKHRNYGNLNGFDAENLVIDWRLVAASFDKEIQTYSSTRSGYTRVIRWSDVEVRMQLGYRSALPTKNYVLALSIRCFALQNVANHL